MIKTMLLACTALALAACSQSAGDGAGPAEASQNGEIAAAQSDAERRLDAALDAQPDEVKARYAWRRPKETLQFFGVAPGMTVVEALPGSGWYTKILIPYLGADGVVIGADYALTMWPLFGGDGMADFVAKKETWVADWTVEAQGWRGADDAAMVMAFQFGALPSSMMGTADTVLFIRALHNLARFEAQGGFLSDAIADAYAVLKPGGVVGVVQHRAPDGSSDEWANGENGYLKESRVIDAFTAAGFIFDGASEVNANPADQPTESDMVWRLPPTLGTSRNDAALRTQLQAIGESDRMTLKFRKP